MSEQPNAKPHERQSMRLRHYDYSQAGAYFVTVCTHRRTCLLGSVVNDVMQCNAHGHIVQACWEELPRHYGHVTLDAFVIMPNHVHGIIWIANVGAGSPRPVPSNDARAGAETAPLRQSDVQAAAAGTQVAPLRPPLGQIVAYFKYQASKLINAKRNMPGGAVWQRNYFERVIRNERELNAIRQYIQDNPLRWALDAENPLRQVKGPK
jgi:putative transposase